MHKNIINKAICDDCININKYVKDPIIDMVICSPPYNINLGNNKYNKRPYDLYNDNKDHKDYIEWLMMKMVRLMPLLKDGARVCINIGDGKNGKVPTHSDIIQRMTDNLGFLPVTIILWDKGSTSNRTAWGSFQSPLNPSFPRPFEYILVFAHKTHRKEGDKEKITVSKEEFVKFSNGIWKFPGVKHEVHPAVFPEELPYRLIQMLSYAGDLVVDPFCGIGTTLKVAKKLNRRWLGFDISKQYVDIANGI